MNYSTTTYLQASAGKGMHATTTHDAATSSHRYLLDPCYHIEHDDTPLFDDAIRGGITNGRISPCSSDRTSRSSWSQAPSTWKDPMGTHDADFRPFASPVQHKRGHSRSRSLNLEPRRAASCGLPSSADRVLGYRERSMSPPRSHRIRNTTPTLEERPRSSSPAPPSSYYHHPPSKAARRAARQQLDPVLREAIRAHEREMARAKKAERRPSWLKGRSSSCVADSTYDTEDVSMVLCDEPEWEDLSRSPAYSPPPLPELSLYPDDAAAASDESLNELPQSRRSNSPTSEQIKYQLASLSLRIDLALFRAKKLFRRRIGLD